MTLWVGRGVSDVALVDTTGSGLPDIVVTNKLTGLVSVLRNLGGGNFGTPVPYRAGTGLLFPLRRPDGGHAGQRHAQPGDRHHDHAVGAGRRRRRRGEPDVHLGRHHVARGAAAPTFSVNGTNAAKQTVATFSKAGTYGFTVTIADAGGLTTTSSVNVVVNQSLTSIAVSPTSVTVNVGGTQQFTATAKDQFGNAIATQPSFTWTATAGTITTGGLFTAPTTTGSVTVTATSGSCQSSANVNVTNSATTLTPPAAPSFTATAVSATQINLAWTPVAGATGYLVDQWINGAWKQVGSLGSGSTGYAVTGLSPNTTYYFDVVAYNAAGTIWANYQSATTQNIALPAAPLFTATAVSATQINLAWTPVAGATGYLVDQWINGALEADRSSLSSGSTSYVVAGLSPNTTYYFKVAAYNAAARPGRISNPQHPPGGPVVHSHGGFSDADQPGLDPGGQRDRLPGR